MGNFGNGAWLVESDSGNDDWIGDHSGDPESLDSTQYTEGTDSWNAEYVTVEEAGEFVGDYEDIPGWTGIDTSMEEGHDMIKVTGTFQGTSFSNTVAKADALKEFFRNHSSLGDNAFYFVRRWDTDLYDQFPNEDRTMKKYMKAKFTKPPAVKIDNRVLEFSFILRSLW